MVDQAVDKRGSKLGISNSVLLLLSSVLSDVFLQDIQETVIH